MKEDIGAGYSAIERLDLLRTIYSRLWTELDFRREKEKHISTWFTSILTVIGGLLVTLKTGEDPVSFEVSIRIALTTIILGLFVAACVGLVDAASEYSKIARLIVRIHSHFGYYSEGTYFKSGTVLPVEWRNWGKLQSGIKTSQFFYGIVLALIALSDIAIVWSD